MYRKYGLAALALALFAVSTNIGLGGGDKLKGEIKIDGSSTVYLITEAMATQFRKLHPDVNTTVGISGTGGGFKKFSVGETDINDASRAIKPAEAAKCKENNVDFLELQVGWDGLAVIINKDNDFATKLTVEQLKKIWHPNTADFKNAKKWSDVNPEWPAQDIKLFGAGPDSGTFDYFTEVINGKEKVIRTDYGASEDDNNTINAVVSNKNAMGFLGVAYYEANKAKLSVVAVANKGSKDYVLPTPENVLARKYVPLGRPLFIYVKTDSLKRPEVREFAKFYLRRDDLVSAVGYVPMNTVQAAKQRVKLEKALKK